MSNSTFVQAVRGKRWLTSMGLATAVLGGVLLFGGASNAKADDDCYRVERNVQYTGWRAHEASEEFGYFSREARHWRHENHEARERLGHCRHRHRDYYNRNYDRDDYYRRW